jgi:hypothetical protein
LASSRRPKRGESALRKRCALKKFTKRLSFRLRAGLSRAKKSGGTGQHDQSGSGY